MEVDFENCGEIVSLSDIEFVAQTHTTSPGLMVIHFESVRLEKMSMTLEILVKMMSPTCFEEFIIGTQVWFLYSFVSLIFLQLVVQEKEYVKHNMGTKMGDKVVENLTQGR